MGERIDAHHHLWSYREEQYEWIGPGMKAIARDFLPADLETELAVCGVDGSVVVQARQTLEETNWLLELAANSGKIRGVVGWAPIVSPDFSRVLEELSEKRKLKGLRHVIQAEPDDEFILRDDFNNGIRSLAGSSLVYDILIYDRHLPATMKFVDRHPKQIFVLDHIAKPRIREHLLEPWKANLFELAERENVYGKLSGLVTEADWKNWTSSDLRPYVEAVVEAFGPSRLMFGSDWPVCLLASNYQEWLRTTQDLLAELSASEKELVFGGVATRIYALDSVR